MKYTSEDEAMRRPLINRLRLLEHERLNVKETDKRISDRARELYDEGQHEISRLRRKLANGEDSQEDREQLKHLLEERKKLQPFLSPAEWNTPQE